LSVKP